MAVSMVTDRGALPLRSVASADARGCGRRVNLDDAAHDRRTPSDQQGDQQADQQGERELVGPVVRLRPHSLGWPWLDVL